MLSENDVNDMHYPEKMRDRHRSAASDTITEAVHMKVRAKAGFVSKAID